MTIQLKVGGSGAKHYHHEKSSANNKLHHPLHRQLCGSTHDAPLLHPWRQTSLVLQLARDRCLAHHPFPYRLCLLSPFQDPTHFPKQAFLHDTKLVPRRRLHRNPHRLRRLPLRLRRRTPSRLDLISNHRLAAGFHRGFAFVLVKQKFTSYSINAVFLLTIGAGVLAMHTSGDRPANESNREYVLGFLMTLGAAALYGFILPLVELTYKKAKQEISYALVMEIQIVMCLFATGVCTIGMLLNNDFKVISREAREYELGESNYYIIVICSAIIWQCFFLGAIGVIFCASSLLSGIIIAVLLPVTEILAVIFYKESFHAEKGVALALSLWGFLSYFYGEIKDSKKTKPPLQTEMTSVSDRQESV
ncbi:hypothetical protein GQ457_01G011410 [Hibiscus cannabinus]